METMLLNLTKKELNEIVRTESRACSQLQEQAAALNEEAQKRMMVLDIMQRQQKEIESLQDELQQTKVMLDKSQTELAELKNTKEGVEGELSKIVSPASIVKYATEGLDAEGFEGAPHFFSDFLEDCADSASDEVAKELRKHKKAIKSYYQRKKKKLQDSSRAQTLNLYDVHDNQNVVNNQ